MRARTQVVPKAADIVGLYMNPPANAANPADPAQYELPEARLARQQQHVDEQRLDLGKRSPPERGYGFVIVMFVTMKRNATDLWLARSNRSRGAGW